MSWPHDDDPGRCQGVARYAVQCRNRVRNGETRCHLHHAALETAYFRNGPLALESRTFEGTPPAEVELDGVAYRRVPNPEYWLYEVAR